MEQEMMQGMEEAGRGTDAAELGGTMAHLSLGEVVIPRSFLDDPQVVEMLQALFADNGADLAEFTVGDPSNKINPETGYPEFFFKKAFRKIAKIASGGLVKSILPKGLRNVYDTLAPIALTAVGQPGLAAAYSGLNSYGNGGSLGSSLLSAGKTYGLSKIGSDALSDTSLGRGISDVVGSSSKAIQGPLQPGAGSLGSTTGTGVVGALSRAISPSIGGISSGVTGGGSSFSPLAVGANIFGGLQQESALKKQEKALLEATRAQNAEIDAFDPSNITNDAGYQFQLAEGQRGLDRGLAAAGGLQSGRAIRAGQEFGQQFANTAFNQAYQRFLDRRNARNQVIGAAGDIRANRIGASSQNLSQSLSNAIGAPVGAAGQGLTLEQLRQLGLA